MKLNRKKTLLQWSVFYPKSIEIIKMEAWHDAMGFRSFDEHDACSSNVKNRMVRIF
jgi:hypothetical protein